MGLKGANIGSYITRSSNVDGLHELVEATQLGSCDTQRLACAALSKGAAPLDILNTVVIPAATKTVEQLEAAEISVREASARIFAADRVIDVLTAYNGKPLEAPTRILIGSVQDELDCVGERLAVALLRCTGYAVFDLGVDVSPHEFASRAIQNEANVLVLWGEMAATVPHMRRVLGAVGRSGCRQHVQVLIGGSSVTPRLVDLVGADACAPTAFEAARIIRDWASMQTSAEANDYP